MICHGALDDRCGSPSAGRHQLLPWCCYAGLNIPTKQETYVVKTPTRAHIVADGQQRLQAQIDYRQKEQEFLATVTEKYAAELAQANLLRRFLIRRKIWQEVAQQLENLAPDQGLYLKADA